MSEPKHTPGEWGVWGENMGVFHVVAENVSETRVREVVVAVKSSAHQPKGEAEANARLIASAPDMLEALKWVAEHSYAGGKFFGDVDPVKSAIAKANQQ